VFCESFRRSAVRMRIFFIFTRRSASTCATRCNILSCHHQAYLCGRQQPRALCQLRPRCSAAAALASKVSTLVVELLAAVVVVVVVVVMMMLLLVVVVVVVVVKFVVQMSSLLQVLLAP
jgi:hypothetical protein